MGEPTWAPPFWLSHHRFGERQKCVHVGGAYVCARCLATYPVMLAVLALQLRRPMAPLVLPFDALLLFALPIPAALDWAAGQLTAWRGSNALRFASGLLLGGSLGRAAYLYLRHPRDPRVFTYALAGVALGGIVWGLRQVLRKPPRDNDHPHDVEPQTAEELLGDHGGEKRG